MKRWMKATAVGLLTGLLGALFGAMPAGTEFEQDYGLFWMFRARGAVEAPDNVAVVAIDDQTSARVAKLAGDDPVAAADRALPRDWNRSLHVPMLEGLEKLGAAVIVFDMDFNRAKDPHHDRLFAEGIARSNRVILFERLTGKRQPLLGASGEDAGMVWVEQRLPPIPVLADAARAIGPFPLPKLEEALYQFWAFKPSAGGAATLPALALQMEALSDYGLWRDLLIGAGMANADVLPAAADAFSGPNALQDYMVQVRQAFLDDPQISESLALWLDSAQAAALEPARRQRLRALTGLYSGGDSRFLNFFGPPGSIPIIPYHEVVAASLDQPGRPLPDLQGKVVFIGYADLFDPGQPDRFYTVFTRDDGVDLSGVEIAATAFANLAAGRALIPESMLTTALYLFAYGLLIGIIAARCPAHLGVALVVLVTAAYGYYALHLFEESARWLPVAIPLLVQVPIALLVGLLGQYLLERRQRQRYSAAVSYYVPEAVARQLAESSIAPAEANSVVYSICFATDMAGFTTLGESMEAGELASFMNDYFEALSEPLRRHGVDVTEFRADAIMCAWTGEEESAALRLKAASAALDTVQAVAAFSERKAHPIHSRIGLESGWVYVGHAGGGGHFVYSIVGDAANTAARVEGLNKRFGTHILATDAVVEGLDSLLLRPLGRFVFVGKQSASPISEIVAYQHSATDAQRDLCQRFAAALAAFSAHDWQAAADGFRDVLAHHPADGPAQLYRGRATAFAAAAPSLEDPAAVILDSK